MSPARAQNWTAQCRVKHTKHEATGPPGHLYNMMQQTAKPLLLATLVILRSHLVNVANLLGREQMLKQSLSYFKNPCNTAALAYYYDQVFVDGWWLD